MTAPLLALDGVGKVFAHRPDFAERLASRLGARVARPVVHAVAAVDLTVTAGEVMGLVGESGCGKSTLGRIVAGIQPATSGRVLWRGEEKRQPGLGVQMIFQDPMASLNPRMRVRDIIGEAPRVHGLVGRGEWRGHVDAILRRVGLDPACAERYPHQFSGGQRQRIGIARALAVRPEFLVCDESVAALDVSIQAQVINLFMELRREFSLTYLFISHDLGVVEHVSDRIAVMYLGRIVELAPTAELFARPAHPYTAALLEEAPRIETRGRPFSPLAGEIPSPLDPPPGCAFHPRCPHAKPVCRERVPATRAVAPGHRAACHRLEPS